MDLFNFLILLHEIYFKRRIDVDKIQAMGLLAVKIGQIHALRIDLLPEDKCLALSQLYRNATSVPTEDVQRTIQRRGKERLGEVAIDFTRPLATASVGQVYRGTYQGQPVVVKVIKGDFKKRFMRDLRNVRFFTAMATLLYPRLKKVFDPRGVLEHIQSYTLSELDLSSEIHGTETLAAIACQHGIRSIHFPLYYPELSNEDILVSEYIDAPTVDELLASGKFRYEDLLRLFQIHGFYMFIVGTFHGDLHPGNVLVKDGEFYFVDNGSNAVVAQRGGIDRDGSGHRPPPLNRGLFNFFEPLCQYDYRGAAQALYAMSDTAIAPADYRAFEERFIVLYRDFKGASVAQVSLTEKMMQTIKLGVNFGMAFDRGMFPIIKSLMYLDGMALRCNPDAVLLEDMRPFIVQMRQHGLCDGPGA